MNHPHYKLSLVVRGKPEVGAMIDMDRVPEIGEIVTFKRRKYRILELTELMAARDEDFGLVHATCELL